MYENFAKSLALVLRAEGGYVDNPKDPGGPTNKGITLKTYQAFKPGVTKQDLQNISDEDVTDIYKKNYWDAVDGDMLATGIDYCVFDYAVNSGPSRANKARLQAGTVGIVPVNEIIYKICSIRMDFLRKLPTFSVFGKGWEKRVTFVEEQAEKMAYAVSLPEIGILGNAKRKNLEKKPKGRIIGLSWLKC